MVVPVFVFLFHMKQSKTELYLSGLFLFGLLVFFLVVSFLSPGSYGGADNINHYFLSRYAFQRHELFFDGWGRPLYTILSSPFAQFGFNGIKLFNVILATLTVWTAYLTARRLGYSPALLAFVFTAFTPIYFIMIFTALTEILAGFILILAVNLFFREKYIWSAIVISFVHMARSEAMIFYPIFLAALLFKKQYKAAPFIITGSLVFTLIGGVYFKDFLWLVTRFPYPIHHKIYKTPGPLFHFVSQGSYIFGIVLEILLIIGMAAILISLFSKDKEKQKRSFYETVVILAPFAGYFAMHSVLYWKALGGSIGLIRVLTSVMPLAALISLKGYSLIDKKLLGIPWLRYTAMSAISVLLIVITFTTYKFPVPLTEEEQCIRDAASWYKSSPYARHIVFYNDFNFPFFLDINPNDNSRSAQLYYARTLPQLPDSCVVVWDAHFGANECEIPKDSLFNSKRFKLLKIFEPETEMTTYGGYKYEVMAFLKLPSDQSADNLALLGWLKQEEDKKYKDIRTFVNDFEQASPGLDTNRLSRTLFHSGKRSYKMDEASEFSPGFFMKMRELTTAQEGIKVRVSLALYPLSPVEGDQPSIVISLENNEKSYDYHAIPFRTLHLSPGQWTVAETETKLAPLHSGNDQLKIYIYNPGKKTFYIDDLTVQVKENAFGK
jgi:hypothetical protein